MIAIYIGAGVDIKPIKFLKYIKTFYYFDGQPFSEFGTMQSNNIMPNGMDGFSRPNFIPTLDENMESINMKLINKFDNTRIYSDGNQTVYYYTNTAIPDHYEEIKNTIKDFDTLIVAGHDPDSMFLDATINKIHFIGFEGTCYHYENESCDVPDGITNKLHVGEITNRFNKYTYINNKGVQSSFDDWGSYYNYYFNLDFLRKSKLI